MEDQNLLAILEANWRLQTERDLKKNPVLAKKIEKQTKELFNVNPFFRYQLNMSDYHIKEEIWEDTITIRDIKAKGYSNTKFVDVKVGNLTIKRKLLVITPPKIGNKVTNDWNLIKVLNEECPPTWREAFKLSYKQLIYLNDIILDEEKEGKRVVPDKKDIFRAFELCPLNNTLIVIVGQDPYHTVMNGRPDANGLCFSTNKGLKIRPSLRNIYNELDRSIKGFDAPNHGDLTSWAKQGVLMLNAALTVVKSNPESHSYFWQGFTMNIMKVLNKVKPRCIYMLWGGFAKKMKKYINATEYILETSHPSPLSVYRGFKKCDHFNKANEMLESMNETPIDWCIK